MENDDKQQKLFKQKWWAAFLMAFTIVVCWKYVDKIDGFVFEKLSAVGLEPTSIYEALDEAGFLNFLLSVGVVVGLAQLVVRKYSDRCFSFLKTTLVVVVIILLCVQEKFEFADTFVPFIKYNGLIAFGAGLYVIAPWVRRLVEWTSSPKENKKQGKILTLYSDNEEESGISESRAKYAEQLAIRLLNTNVEKEAYAVGIAAEWGSGKTLFLNEVEKAIGDKAIIVKFNPWNSKDERHLAKDFLKTLSQHLFPIYRGISSPIKKYLTLLYSMRIHLASDYVLQYLPKHEEKDLALRKKDIEEALDKIGKPVVVFIDDIDRLEGKEIFEVLRIIRNTAVFRHMIYVVAYDKTHVLTQLSQLNIDNGADYLEKIFQMEVLLPKPDEKMLVSEFKMVCRAMSVAAAPINSVLDTLKEEDYHQMVKVLTSYRKMKRFARQFSFNASYLLKSLTDRDFELQDVLFLSLLEYSDSELYKTLWQKPEELLDVKHHPNNNVRYYSWPKQLKDDAAASQNGQESICDYLLKRLFGSEPNLKTHSIQFVDLFYKYFYLAQPEKELSKKAFEAMLEMNHAPAAHKAMRATVNSWVTTKDNKSCGSIYRAFVKHQTVNCDDFNKCAQYIYAVFYWLQYEEREYDQLKELLPNVLDKARYRANMQDNIRQLASGELKTLAEKKKYRTVAIVLSELYRRLDAGEKLLVDISTVQATLHNSTEHFLKSKPWDPVSLFRDDGNTMRTIVEASCVSLQSKGKQKVNLVIDQVIDYYNQHKSGSYREADEVLQMIPCITVHGQNTPAEKALGDLTLVFGDDHDLPVKMLKSCFNGVK